MEIPLTWAWPLRLVAIAGGVGGSVCHRSAAFAVSAEQTISVTAATDILVARTLVRAAK
jgi:hypothetical protein